MYFEDHKNIRKSQELVHYYDYNKVESLDHLITMGMTSAENQCKHNQRLPWSPEVNKVVTRANILKISLSSINNKINLTAQIESQQSNLKERYEAPTTKKEITKELRKARQEIRILWKKKRSLRSTIYEDQEQAFIESHPKMDPKKAKAIFKKAELTNEIMAELPKRKHHSGGLNAIAVPLGTGTDIAFRPPE